MICNECSRRVLVADAFTCIHYGISINSMHIIRACKEFHTEERNRPPKDMFEIHKFISTLRDKLDEIEHKPKKAKNFL